MAPRTLRAANAPLYGTSVLLVIAAILYCATYKEMPAWQLWGGVALSSAAVVWGLYYVTLCYHISAKGISRHSFLRCTHCLLWTEVARAELAESEANGLATCRITLHPKSGAPLSLSSDVLPLEDMQELAADLRTAGLLPPENTSPNTP